MNSTRQAPTKRKAAPAEEPVSKKPRTTAKPLTTNNVKSKVKTTALKKTTEQVAKIKPVPAKKAVVKGKEREIPDNADAVADSEEKNERPTPSPKQSKLPKQPKVSKQPTRAPLKLPVINTVPTEILDVYVFGDGTASELGLGNAKNATNVKRPRLNPNLSAEEVGVVAVACGGMHSAAITHDNLILTWGVNDLGALGRDTTWNGGWKEAKAGSDDSEDEDEIALNPYECQPVAISTDHFPEGTKFAALVCGDSSTFVLTDTGLVYGWGTFRVSWVQSSCLYDSFH